MDKPVHNDGMPQNPFVLSRFRPMGDGPPESAVPFNARSASGSTRGLRLCHRGVAAGVTARASWLLGLSPHATKVVQDAEQRAAAMNEAMESRRGALQKHVDELRTFEREYRTRLKSYLESQLRDLERGGTRSRATTPASRPFLAQRRRRISFTVGVVRNSWSSATFPTDGSSSATPSARAKYPRLTAVPTTWSR